MSPIEQLETLAAYPRRFDDAVATALGRPEIAPLTLDTFQINVGKVCNQACHHCHVDASPKRTENMSAEIAAACIAALTAAPQVKTVDITGGAPELNPHFRDLVRAARRLGKRVIDRCNLTILEEPGQEDLAEFLAEHQVEVIASLPHFAAARTDQQRGRGVFDASIRGLKRLNALGYGRELPLHLVYNPSGVLLSGSQAQLEREFKENLSRNHGVTFNSLFCINNMPISRHLAALLRAGKFESYMETLVNAFNPGTLDGLMCRHQVSVGYDGALYDCDFNQMLEMPAQIGHIRDFSAQGFLNRRIALHNHCFGCTAGAGSSCGGEIAS